MAKTKTRKPPRAPKPPKLTRQQRAADTNPLYDPSQILHGHGLADAADAIVSAEYTPKLAALGREARSTQTQGTALANRAADYYGQLASRAGKAVDIQGAVAQQLRQGLGDVAATASAATDTAQKSVLDRLAADAAARGPGLSGGGDQAVMDQLAAQRANQAQTSQAFQSAGEAQAARSAQLQADLASSTQARGGELQGELLNRVANSLADIRGQRTDLEAQRGDERTKQLQTLRQQGFEDLVTTRGLGLKQQQLAADVANQQTQAELAAQRAAEAQRHNLAGERNQRSGTRQQAAALTERERHNQVIEGLSQLRTDIAQQKANSGGGSGKKGTKESQSAVNIKRGIQNTLNLLTNGTHSERYLTNKVGVPPDVMQAAKDLKAFGYLQYDTVGALKRIGVKIPRSWQPPAVGRSAPH